MLWGFKDAFPAEVGNVLLQTFAMDIFVQNLFYCWILEPSSFGKSVQCTRGVLEIGIKMPMVVRMLRAIGSIEGENLHTKVICKWLHAGIHSQGKSNLGGHRRCVDRVDLDSRPKVFQVAKLLDWHP